MDNRWSSYIHVAGEPSRRGCCPKIAAKSSEYRGVSWDKSHNQWRAFIRVAGNLEHLGYFDDEAEAARAYDTHARQLGYPPNFDLNGVEIDYSA